MEVNVNTGRAVINEDWHVSVIQLEDMAPYLTNDHVPDFDAREQDVAGVLSLGTLYADFRADEHSHRACFRVFGDDSWPVRLPQSHQNCGWNVVALLRSFVQTRERALEEEKWSACEERSPVKICGQSHGDHFFQLEEPHYQHQVPSKGKVNAEHYRDVLKTLQCYVNQRRPQLKNQYHLHHDNARPHTARIITEYLEANSICVIPYPPYLPDLASCDFWLFPTLKKSLRECRFNSDEEVMQVVHTCFSSLPAAEFEKTIKIKWQESLERCIEHRGRYFVKAGSEKIDIETDVSDSK